MAERDRASANAVGGYVLAGGRSSRMGRDKALLELAGRPLIAHAVARLRRVTGEANILAGEAPGNAALSAFGPLVFDTKPGCGPLGGIEAALRDSKHDWNLILPVDVPFLPAALLEWWVGEVTASGRCFVSTFRAGGRVQPGVLLLHRAVTAFVAAALERGEYKLLPVLEEAARQLGGNDGENALYIVPADEMQSAGAGGAAFLTEAQRRALPLWFSNLNTPAEFAEAGRHTDALDAVG